MYDPNEHFDERTVSDSVAQHVEQQMEKQQEQEERVSPSYSDAGYILSDEAPTTPRRYYTPPEKAEKPPKAEKPKKEKKQGVFGKVMAGVLCGLLMGAAIGVGIMGMLENSFKPEVNEPPAIESPMPTPAPTPMLTVSTLPEGEMPATEIYNIATSQVVGIRTDITGYNIWGQVTTNAVSGTGFIVSEDGYIITNHHVIEDAYQGGYEVNVILYNGDSYVAEIVGYEKADSDIAVLKIDAAGLNPAKLGDSSTMAVGETVYAVGNPLGELTYTMTRGMVSALDREITTSYTEGYNTVTSTMNMFQIDAAVNSGNSGGPVYNSKGEVVGVVTAKSNASGTEGLGFALPINDAVDIANDLITQGYVSGKPYMGVQVETMPQSVTAYYGVPVGAFVRGVDANTAAERAGLQQGDIITKMDEHEINGSSALKSVIKEYRAGDTVTVTVYRNGEELQLSLTFDEAVPQETSQPTSAQDYYGNFFGKSNSKESY